jgi:hypothetical protein
MILQLEKGSGQRKVAVEKRKEPEKKSGWKKVATEKRKRLAV